MAGALLSAFLEFGEEPSLASDEFWFGGVNALLKDVKVTMPSG